MEEFENPANTKKSFERLKADSDDSNEVYIVHDVDDQEQNDLFMQPPDLEFDSKEDEPKQRRLSQDDFEKVEHPDKKPFADMAAENPFKDTMANSEMLPETKKLNTQIIDDYMAANTN